MRYTEIDVSLYDNPKLKSKPKKEFVSASDEVDGGGEPMRERQQKLSKRKKHSLHEDILLFVGKEWKDLKLEVDCRH